MNTDAVLFFSIGGKWHPKGAMKQPFQVPLAYIKNKKLECIDDIDDYLKFENSKKFLKNKNFMLASILES